MFKARIVSSAGGREGLVSEKIGVQTARVRREKMVRDLQTNRVCGGKTSIAPLPPDSARAEVKSAGLLKLFILFVFVKSCFPGALQARSTLKGN